MARTRSACVSTQRVSPTWAVSSTTRATRMCSSSASFAITTRGCRALLSLLLATFHRSRNWPTTTDMQMSLAKLCLVCAVLGIARSCSTDWPACSLMLAVVPRQGRERRRPVRVREARSPRLPPGLPATVRVPPQGRPRGPGRDVTRALLTRCRQRLPARDVRVSEFDVHAHAQCTCTVHMHSAHAHARMSRASRGMLGVLLLCLFI